MPSKYFSINMEETLLVQPPSWETELLNLPDYGPRTRKAARPDTNLGGKIKLRLRSL